MKAITHQVYGGPEVLALREVDTPECGADQVLIRVLAAAVNPLDWHFMRGTPYFLRLDSGLRKPKRIVTGADVAGRVEVVGNNITGFSVGDEVFGQAPGSCAEFVLGRARALAPKPVGLTFEEAAAVPVAACTALQALRDQGRLKPGQSVLINGAAGGVGTFAVQVAKALGAKVTGVCSTQNVGLVRSLGADSVLDYTQDDFTRSELRYDVVIDTVGNHSLLACRRALTPRGTYVLVGAQGGNLLGGLERFVRALVLSRFGTKRMVAFVAAVREPDLVALTELIDAGKLKPAIDRRYPLEETSAAIGYLEQGHARGKVVITI